MSENSRIVYAILSFLNEEFNKPTTSSDNKESLEVAMQCLETAFGLSLRDTHLRGPRSLRELLSNDTASPPVSAPTPMMTDSPPRNLAQSNQVSIDKRLGDLYSAPPEVSEDIKLKADEHKNLGNDKMKEASYTEALRLYSMAIELDGGNAVYFCNRAAAYLKLDMLNEGLRDCQIAAQLLPNYARAYGRMGVVYSTMGKHHDAALCYEKAIELEPNNESYMNNLKVAKDMIEEGAGDASNNMGNGGLGAAMGAAGGGVGPNFQNLFTNPNLVQMAGQMLQDPQMQNLMRNIMGGFQNQQQQPTEGTPGTPNFDTFLQMGQAIAQQIRSTNPNLADQIHNRFNNGQDPPPGDNSNNQNNQ